MKIGDAPTGIHKIRIPIENSQELRRNSDAICFLQSEFFKNFNIDSFLEQTKELNENWRYFCWNSTNKNPDWKLHVLHINVWVT